MPTYSKYSDEELLIRLKDGDHLAYTEIYDRYNGHLYIFAYRRLKNREETKDLIHELFLKLWSDREDIAEKYTLIAYLYTALRNRIINQITRQKVSTKYIESFNKYLTNLCDDTDFLVRQKDLQKVIEEEIANLNPRTRKVFELSRKKNLSRKEIAQELNISPETVKSHMHSALKILKLKLGDLYIFLF
ncbi:RNA polymerase sigma-70 factor [Pseudopedobacter sp.]|uniref:RNA polymerase sigma factor n=1 Tax=Pseudopedobacter sp. TaxID=1936787 RepID=UPI003340AF1E